MKREARLFRDHSAAPSSAITFDRRGDRDGDELIGICRGILADGTVNKLEGKFLLGFLRRHDEFHDRYPFSILYARVRDALKSGVLDGEEERHLLEAVHSLVGGEADDESGSASLASTLPLDQPPPIIEYEDKLFVVTGTFQFGSRRLVINAIEAMGGAMRQAISPMTDYLIIGAIGSRDWIHSSYGRKIEAAVQLREAGARIAIVSEMHWKESIRVVEPA